MNILLTITELCLTEYPVVENAMVTYKEWNGKYPAPSGALVVFTCVQGFTDGKREHWTLCSSSPDTWCTSFIDNKVKCPKAVYPECRKTVKGKEYMGRMNKTETGKDCLRWDSKPYDKPNDFEIAISNPAMKERPWCFVSDRNIQWEYCDIPFCEDKDEVHLPSKGWQFLRGEVEREEEMLKEVPKDGDEPVVAGKKRLVLAQKHRLPLQLRCEVPKSVLAAIARISDEQEADVGRTAQTGEQQEAAKAELRNKRAVQLPEQLDARNAALKCRKPGGGRELNPVLLAGLVCYYYTTEFGTFCQATPCHLKSLPSFAERALSGCTF
ncbi:unnamed protein product [Darwinula stevensoni]|uniref:Kringle domain-containing protein n=1 Tax=Darwinula stevensoni TaxID=69355 RepID=A0A7R9A4Y8_9CRUS|nr:unnamed protein product [Darwinula stevensoni]CAG0893484.1 unnamed protein product [Darwinula stevensoni]